MNDWYDYENQKAISLPPVGIECQMEYDGDFIIVETLFRNEACLLWKCINNRGLDHTFDTEYVSRNYDHYKFRPLDWNKNQTKIVSLDWLVGSGIDCEFMDTGNTWYVGALTGFNNSQYRYLDNYDNSTMKCRPRMNTPMVLTDEQRNSIPDCFNITTKLLHDGYIVTFKGLKDGCKYEWEQ